MATISTSSIVDGQIIYAEHVLRIINALNGTASNEIIIADSLSQGSTSNIITGIGSHAEGSGSTASGNYSHTEGRNTLASGDFSHAEGTNTAASGLYSHAEGRGTAAVGDASHAEGADTVANGNYSHAEGRGTETGADYQLAAGQYNTTGNTTDYVVIGYGSDASNRADALGVNAAGTYISSSLYLPTLEMVDQSIGVILFDENTKRTYYTSSANLIISQSLQSISSSYAESSSYAVTASYVDLGPLSFDSESLGVSAIAVNAATTTILPRSPIYNNGTGGIGAYLSASVVGVLGTIDGVTLVVGDTLLVKNQASQIQNGIYEVISTGSASTTYLLSRSLFADETAEFDPQVVIPAAGTISRGLAFSQNTHNPIIGTNNITYSQQTGVFVAQQTTGTQNIYQIPWWTGVNRQLSRGSNNLKYINVTVGPNVTTSSLILTGSLIVSGNFSQSPGSGHILTYDTSSGVFSYTASSAIGGGGGTPTLQQVLDFNHDLVDGNNFQGTGAGVGGVIYESNVFGTNAGLIASITSSNAFGEWAAYNAIGNYINAIGQNAAYNAQGDHIVAIGGGAAYQSISGNHKIAIGYSSYYGGQGSDIISIGNSALYQPGSAASNIIAIGKEAAYQIGSNSNGESIILGTQAAYQADTNSDIIIGYNAGYLLKEDSTIGGLNTLIGHNAGANDGIIPYNPSIYRSIAIGVSAGSQVSGSYNIFIGDTAGGGSVVSNNNIGIGNSALYANANTSESIAIGNGAATSNNGSQIIALGSGSANNNLLSNMFIIKNEYLPSFPDSASASASINIGTGASAGNTYLYYDASTESVRAIRL